MNFFKYRKEDNKSRGTLPQHTELYDRRSRAGEDTLSVRGVQRERQLLGVLSREPHDSRIALDVGHHITGLPRSVHRRPAHQ